MMNKIFDLLLNEAGAQPAVPPAVNRRGFLAGAAAVGLGALVLGAGPALAQDNAGGAMAGAPMAGGAMAGAPRNAREFMNALAGPSAVALATSQVAMRQATDSSVKAFAVFETSEQTAAGTVLKEMGVPVPDATADPQVAQLSALQGAAFDRAYVQAQIQGHQVLKGLVQGFLANADENKPEEMHARHLAMVMLPTITEHLGHLDMLRMALGNG